MSHPSITRPCWISVATIKTDSSSSLGAHRLFTKGKPRQRRHCRALTIKAIERKTKNRLGLTSSTKRTSVPCVCVHLARTRTAKLCPRRVASCTPFSILREFIMLEKKYPETSIMLGRTASTSGSYDFQDL
ncbi:hypothetical protein FRC19_003866 [Serendipita sp. 401]|nr:hypothetical protein FRC19_003866 [Serendipita sp. 401]